MFTDWSPTPGREYPPEPFIGYGAFNHRSQPLKQYSSAKPVLGYGIINLPASASGLVMDERHEDLDYYLVRAKTKWQEECANIDWEFVDNPFECLVGAQLFYCYVNTDGFGGELMFDEPPMGRMTFAFDYSEKCLITGMKSRQEVNEFLTENYGARVTAVDGVVLTLNEKFTFAIEPKYADKFTPPLTTSSGLKTILLRNLAMQRAKRDSTQEIALAA